MRDSSERRMAIAGVSPVPIVLFGVLANRLAPNGGDSGRFMRIA